MFHGHSKTCGNGGLLYWSTTRQQLPSRQQSVDHLYPRHHFPLTCFPSFHLITWLPNLTLSLSVCLLKCNIHVLQTHGHRKMLQKTILFLFLPLPRTHTETHPGKLNKIRHHNAFSQCPPVTLNFKNSLNFNN